MATPPPGPPPSNPPGPPPGIPDDMRYPIHHRSAGDDSELDFTSYSTGPGRDQLNVMDDQLTIYNRTERELQGKTSRTVDGVKTVTWKKVNVPFGVIGGAISDFFEAIDAGLRDIAGIKQQGIGRWKAQQDYSMHARVVGSDGKIYTKLRSTNANPDPVTEAADPRVDWALDNPWMDDMPEPSYKGVAVAGGHVHADGTLVTGESWGVSSVTRSGTNSDSYLYTVILDVPVDDNEYYVQAHSIVDVTDVTIIPIIPSDPPCFTVQFEKRVNANTVHEGIARAFYFTVYGK